MMKENYKHTMLFGIPADNKNGRYNYREFVLCLIAEDGEYLLNLMIAPLKMTPHQASQFYKIMN
jgi:hypothetical protein